MDTLNGVAARTDNTTVWDHNRGTDALLRDVNDINPGDFRAYASPIPVDSQDNEGECEPDGSIVGYVVLAMFIAATIVGIWGLMK